MFNLYIHSFIDSVQDIKLNAVEQFVPHSDVKNALKSWVNAQREYTKSAADSLITVGTTLGYAMSKSQFYTELQKNFTDLFSTSSGRK